MILQCPHCEARYSVEEHLLGHKGRKLKCAVCENVFHSSEALPPSEEKPHADEPPPPSPDATPPDETPVEEDGWDDQADALTQEPSDDSMEGLTDGEDAMEGLTDGEDEMEGLTDGEDEMEGLTDGEDGLEGLTDGEDEMEDLTDGEDGLEGLTDGEDGLEGLTDGEDEMEGLTDGEDGLEGLTDDEEGLGDLTDLDTAYNEGEELPEGLEDDLKDMVVENGPEEHLMEEMEDHPLEEVDLSDEAFMEDGGLLSEEDLEEIDLDGETVLAEEGMGLDPDEQEALEDLSLDSKLTGDEEEALGNLGFATGDLLDGDEEPATEIAPTSARTQKLDMEDAIPTKAATPAFVPPVPKEKQRKLAHAAGGRRFNFRVPVPSAMTMIVILMLTLVGQWFSNLDWVHYWSENLNSAYKLGSLVPPVWEETDCCQILIFEGRIANTTRIAQDAPLVKMVLRDAQGKELMSTVTAPGRKLTAEEKKSSEVTLREMVTLMGQVDIGKRRIPLPKIAPENTVAFQAIFVNPHEDARSYEVILEPYGSDAKRSGGMRSFLLN